MPIERGWRLVCWARPATPRRCPTGPAMLPLPGVRLQMCRGQPPFPAETWSIAAFAMTAAISVRGCTNSDRLDELPSHAAESLDRSHVVTGPETPEFKHAIPASPCLALLCQTRPCHASILAQASTECSACDLLVRKTSEQTALLRPVIPESDA